MADTLARPQAPWALRLLPPFPAIANRILALASQEDVSLRQLGEIVQMDLSFSAELLRVANSALFSLRRKVTSLSQAISVVGTDRVKTMATWSPSTGWCEPRQPSEPYARYGFTSW